MEVGRLKFDFIEAAAVLLKPDSTRLICVHCSRCWSRKRDRPAEFAHVGRRACIPDLACRLSKFLLRQGQRPLAGMRAWTIAYMTWVRQLRFTEPAQDAARLDYLHEVEQLSARITRLEESLREAVQQAPPQLQAVIQGLQAMRGIALISAVTMASEIGAVSRFQNARQLMSYSGTVPSENSSGKRTQRGGITKSGNAHLRRILGEAAWSYRRKPAIGPALRKRQDGVPEEIRQIAWKAQVRLSKRYARLQAANKDPGKIVTAVSREMLGFIWAIGLWAESSNSQATAA